MICPDKEEEGLEWRMVKQYDIILYRTWTLHFKMNAIKQLENFELNFKWNGETKISVELF